MLTHLKLENFRNHKNLEIELGRTTFIVGPNGAGKSNILEAISVLSFCRSYRDEVKSNLICFDSTFARIVSDDLEICLMKTPQSALRAKSKGILKKAVDFVGELPAVVLTPESFSIIIGGPNERRRFLDLMLSQTSQTYLRALVDYNKVKKQRNRLLKNIHLGISNPKELDYWDRELVLFGDLITEERIRSVNFINNLIRQIYESIAESKDKTLEIVYQKSSHNLESDLIKFRTKDIATERSNFGPHRDDLIFEFDGRNMSNFASRGEMKSALLALKISELKYLENESKKQGYREKAEPILLLDDVFSEFDAKHREHLSKLIVEYQTVITSTDRSLLDDKSLGKVKVIDLG
jgi:DNA replication and repair protein RecF